MVDVMLAQSRNFQPIPIILLVNLYFFIYILNLYRLVYFFENVFKIEASILK